jgi:RHS repeat-associated protein
MRDNTGLTYLLGDHLGSTSITTNTSGAFTSELRYRAFGDTRYTSGGIPTRYRFTGQRSYTPDFGLYYYGSRWYDPALGRFIQPDSIVPDPYNPQDLNRFSYVRNNPLRYTDPTGHRACDDFDTAGGCYTAPGGGGMGFGGLQPKPRPQPDPEPAPNPSTDDGVGPSTFASDLAYGADVAGVVLADMEMIVVDTIGALVIADGCITGVGCPAAIGTAVFLDYAVSRWSTLGFTENVAGGIALVGTAVADFQSGTSYWRSDRNQITIGVGQDTAVSLSNFIAGQVPEANYDAWISKKQLEYDNRRRLGELPGVTMFEINIPRITIPPPLHW